MVRTPYKPCFDLTMAQLMSVLVAWLAAAAGDDDAMVAVMMARNAVAVLVA